MLSKKLLQANNRYQLSPASDSDSSSLILACPFNDNYGLSDMSPIIRGFGNSYNLITNNASLDTSRNKFYNSSIQVASPFPSSSVRIQTSANIPAFGSNDFCVETWLYVPSIGTNNCAVFYNHNDTNNGFQCLILGSSTGYSGKLYFSGGAGGDVSRSGNSIPLGQWFHFAFTRSSTVLRLFINGVNSIQIGGTVTTNFTLSSAARLFVQFDTTYNTVRAQDFRIYQGSAKYTSNFTPPGAMFI